MFDPTAFDNMKVVIEGALYDLDIDGEIIITDRNDFMNIAKLSRRFDVTFTLPESNVFAKIELESTLQNLAAELLTSSLLENQAGCRVRLQFFLEGQFEQKDYEIAEDTLLKIWGKTRKVTQSVSYNPLDCSKKRENVISVEFDRQVMEEQIDDLVEMVDFMIISIQQLQIINRAK